MIRALRNSMARSKPGHARELIQLFRFWAAARPRLNYQLAIIQRNDPQALVGCCGVRCADSEPGTAELGIELALEYWGRYAYATEVLRGLVELGFGTLELQAIYGGTVSANTRVARLVSSFGATAVVRPTWEGGRLARRSSRHAEARGEQRAVSEETT
jgi:ribosomal-protein-alanine N-acetyltransferase